ncbi:uncharacterized protein OCT59_022648 [Rhizophagus irregularis]|uniref:Fun19p n=2 Tax=Rhizophagus irregularis TaxID=588596 RepID=A0A015JH70_RHIIW|nr:Fun19p [Rhizophagus irregularis DAOM 197198w]UZO29159.1 hypothetical protein OCT59_022648 [Rhizophagus irregularis]GBC50811.2 Clr6 associated factor 2 [Rhizophagus irregularis DAOM 181602=DAOM 197198]
MSSNLLMQVPITTTKGAKFAPPLSPPLSPDSNIFKNSESSSPSSSSSSSLSNIINEVEHVEIISNKPKPKNKYRMRLCDAPPELLEMIKRSEMKNEKSLPEKSITSNTVVKTVSTSTITNNSSFHKIITSDEKRHRFRKNPYPKKAPSKSSPGITLQVDVYTTLKEDPKALLRRSDSSTTSSISSSSSFLSSFNDSSSGTESSPPQSPQRSSSKKQITKTKTKTKRTKPIISERKRKGNSLARVMADRGLLESTLTPIVVAGEIKPIRIPPPPPMQFDELMKNIEQLNLDLTVLQRINPKISWKGQPLSILHLPHYNSLHSKEAHVASTLRLTPVQYLTAKHTLISSARRYVQKSLPFRKSDAQKLLRIDVNKASKLWEFFMQVKWI